MVQSVHCFNTVMAPIEVCDCVQYRCDGCRYLNEVDQLISYLADIHQPHHVLPDIVLLHGLHIYASRSTVVTFFLSFVLFLQAITC